MPTVYPGRYSAQIEGDFVVFLIGMRINRLFALHKWLPVARAMPRMLTELYRQPALGMLQAQSSISGRVVTVVQYWRSFEHLHAYAHNRDAQHLPAWAAFNRSIGNNGTVGIWHETYLVQAGQYESVYANMPRFGLGAAANHVPATGRMNTARSRLQPEPPADSQNV